MDKELYKCLNEYGNEITQDGMDVSIVSISKKTRRMHFAGAFRPLIIVREGQVLELRGSRYPLGFYSGINKIFEEQVMLLQPGDVLYLFSDGFTDQFGGEENKKLNRKNFRELLKTAAEMPAQEQESFLDYAFNNWKQETEQTDDVLVIGIKI
jgi:serine phosphatase RsbU (regulator of sigma subunit)